MESPILRIAVPSPLRRRFDYLPPAGHHGALYPGQRVRVPFGRRTAVGLILEVTEHSDLPNASLKAALEVLDAAPLLTPGELALLEWATRYYHHPPGEAAAAAVPAALRRGEPARARGIRRWALTPEGRALAADALARAPRQAELVTTLRETEALTGSALAEVNPAWREPMRRLVAKGWVSVQEAPCLVAAETEPTPAPALNTDQAEALEAMSAALGTFQPFLLDGVTGSGKTEVYLSLIERAIAAGGQALVLVPEIGLTPQLLRRFRRRLSVPIAVLHSGLSDGERLCAWLMAREGRAPVIIGTRSAVFVPLQTPGVIIVDEEHDASFKQQDGFRYSARDTAVIRARQAGIPVVLGSATPALESLYNATQGRYRRLALPERTGAAGHPAIRLLDLRRQPMREGLSEPLLAAMERHLGEGGRVLLFLNRRGYAPTLLCHECGWVANCARCDAHLTFHQGQRRLRCHHCGSERPVDPQCRDCGSLDLRPIGQGTERVEQVLRERFPETGVLRIDRDNTRRKGAMERLLHSARHGEGRILIGTQMLAKGHHLPEITLVGVLDADQGLFSADFRASERMAQLIVQVAGRAGRGERPGEVLVQTHHPDHPLLRDLIEGGYHRFAEAALAERRETELPPFSFLALLRAEAVAPKAPNAFLRDAFALAQELGADEVHLLGPVPAPMERRAGRYRAQLLLQSSSRKALHGLVGRWAPALEGLKSGRKVRWSLDVDPAEMF